MLPLNLNDYKTILKYYKINYDKMTNKQIKTKAENVLAEKLCKCIKKVDTIPTRKTQTPINEKRTIPICKDSVFKKKGLHLYGFTCKKKPTLKSKKNTRRKLSKLNKTLKIKNKIK